MGFNKRIHLLHVTFKNAINQHSDLSIIIISKCLVLFLGESLYVCV